MRVLWLVVLVACSKEPRKEAPKEPPPRPQLRLPPVPGEPIKVRYAAKTETAANGANPTFFNIVEDEGLFVVADGVPLKSDPAKLAAQGVSPLAGEDCKDTAPDAQLACAVRRVNDRLVTTEAGSASIAAVVVADGHAYAAISGTAWVVRIQRGTRELTVQSAREPLKPLGTSATAALSIYELDLDVGDTIAIVNRAVIDVLGPDGIARALPATMPDPKALEAGVETLVAAAIRGAEHPAVAVIVLHGVAAAPPMP